MFLLTAVLLLTRGTTAQFTFGMQDVALGANTLAGAWDDIADLTEYGWQTASREAWLKKAAEVLHRSMPNYPFVISINGLGPTNGCLSYHHEHPTFDVAFGNLQHWLPCIVEHHNDGGWLNWYYVAGGGPFKSFWIRKNFKDVYDNEYTQLTLSLDPETIIY